MVRRRARTRSQTLTTALNNYALACEVEGRDDDVIPAYVRVLALAPDNVNAHYYRALTLLSRGRLPEGWREYVWRWKRPDTAALHGRFDLPYWQGEDVRGPAASVLDGTRAGRRTHRSQHGSGPDRPRCPRDAAVFAALGADPATRVSRDYRRVGRGHIARAIRSCAKDFAFQASMSGIGRPFAADGRGELSASHLVSGVSDPAPRGRVAPRRFMSRATLRTWLP